MLTPGAAHPADGRRPVERSLIIAADPWLRRALRRAVREVFGGAVEVAPRFRRNARESYDLVVLDSDFFDDHSNELVGEVIERRPRPVTVVLAANAPARAAFQLGQLGVEAFLQKPFTLTEFKAELACTRAHPPSLELLGRSWVGRVDLRAAQVDVRRGMLDQALQLSNGNLSRAARILSVSRQALQRTARTSRIRLSEAPSIPEPLDEGTDTE